MKLLPFKEIGKETGEICPAFHAKEEFEKYRELETRCLWCKNAQWHIGGPDAVDGMGGCLCIAGCDVKKAGEFPWQPKTTVD